MRLADGDTRAQYEERKAAQARLYEAIAQAANGFSFDLPDGERVTLEAKTVTHRDAGTWWVGAWPIKANGEIFDAYDMPLATLAARVVELEAENAALRAGCLSFPRTRP